MQTRCVKVVTLVSKIKFSAKSLTTIHKIDSITRWRSSEVTSVQLLYMYSERMLKMGGGQVTDSLTLASHWKNRARAGEDVGCNGILLSTVCTQLSLAMKALCPEIASGLWHLE